VFEKLLKQCYAYNTSGNINAEKRKTFNQKGKRRETQSKKGKAKQNTEVLNSKWSFAKLFFLFTPSLIL
jgi:hypothetical protein